VGHNATCVTKCQDGSTLALWRITGIHSFVPPVCDPPAVRKWLRDAIVHDGPSPRSMSGMYGWNSATSKCDNAQGDHYVVLVGYDHAAGVFIAKNSWGATWNGNGYFKIAYGSCGMDGSGTTIDQVIPP
jgi:hypothetical protein